MSELILNSYHAILSSLKYTMGGYPELFLSHALYCYWVIDPPEALKPSLFWPVSLTSPGQLCLLQLSPLPADKPRPGCSGAHFHPRVEAGGFHREGPLPQATLPGPFLSLPAQPRLHLTALTSPAPTGPPEQEPLYCHRNLSIFS